MLNCDESKNIKHLIPYIKGEIDVKCVAPFYKEQHIAKKDSEEESMIFTQESLFDLF